MDRKIETWADYWNLFDNLCHSLTGHNHAEVAVSVQEAQKYVNGLTDGWHEFLHCFQQVMKHNFMRTIWKRMGKIAYLKNKTPYYKDPILCFIFYFLSSLLT
jgi:hypothetical protein